MRATFFGIEIGKRAIMTQRTAMEVTSHNIANANTEGYARQRAVISSTDPWTVPGYNSPTTGQQVGTGVDVTKIESLRNEFIDEKITRETSNLSQWTLSSDLMSEVEAIINEPNDATLRDQLDKFWAAWQSLSLNPSNEALRRNIVEETTSLISSFQDIDDRLAQLQGVADHEFEGSIENQLEDAVNQVNSLTKRIAQLNLDIERAETAGANANDLRDKRLSLVQELSGFLAVDSSYDSKGHLTLRTGTRLLVENSTAYELHVVKKNQDFPTTVAFSTDYPQVSDNPDVAEAVFDHSASSSNITLTVAQTATAHQVYSFLSYNPLTGPLSDFGVSNGTFSINGRTFYLDAEHTSMQQLATMISEANVEVNAKLNEAGQLVMTSTLTGTAHQMQFADGTSNLMTVLNLQQNMAARDAIFNYNGKQYVTAENVVRNVVPGATLILKGTGVANMDLRPTITGGKIQGLLETRDGGIQDLRDKFNEMAYRLVTEVNTVHRKGFGLDGVSGRNFFKAISTDDPNLPYKDVIKRLALEDYIATDLNTIAAAQGTLENPNDKLPSYNGDGDGLNAILIAQIKQNRYFSDGKSNFNDFYNAIVTQAATQTQTLNHRQAATEDLMNQLKAQRDEVSGVSLDEELTNLIKFQHAYNAAAKIITTINEMLDKVINQMI